MKPPLMRSGTTRMHFALLSTSSGIPLSGIDIIACRTSTDFCRRSTVSSRAEPAHALSSNHANETDQQNLVLKVNTAQKFHQAYSRFRVKRLLFSMSDI